MKYIASILITVCCQTVIFAEEFILTDNVSKTDYGPYTYRNGETIISSDYKLEILKENTFYIKGVVKGVGWRWGSFSLTNNARILIPKVNLDLKVVMGSQAEKKALLIKEEAQKNQDFKKGLDYYLGNTVPTDYWKAVPLFRKAAERGHAEAQYWLGTCYLKGHGVVESEEKSFSWFVKSIQSGSVNGRVKLSELMENKMCISQAESRRISMLELENKGDGTAVYILGLIFNYGWGVEKDKPRSFNYFEKGALKYNNLGCMAALGSIYAEDNGVPKDEAIAAEWYRKAAQQGDAEAQCNLGEHYFDGRGVTRNKATAAEWYRKAGEQGYARGQDRLGLIYSLGQGVQKDEAIALEWYRKATEQGFAAAQNKLGVMYEKGQGVPKDEAIAAEWYRKAAEQSDAAAQRNLGSLYFIGKGVPKNEPLAAEWFLKAAMRGNASAQLVLGGQYLDGLGVPKNETLGAEWIRKAADQGFATAQYVLGAIYLKGQGVPKNEALALEWFRKAAAQGEDSAQYVLGRMYANGVGVLKDEAIAAEWYLKAAEQGNKDAVAALKKIPKNNRN